MTFTELVSAPLPAQVTKGAGSRLLTGTLSALYYMYFYSLCLIWCVPVFAAGFFLRRWDPDKRLAHGLTRALAFHLMRINPRWQIKFENVGNYDPQKTYVLVANHQSMADVLALSGLGGFYKWIAKSQIFAMPGVGQLLRLNDYVCVSQGSLKSVRRMMKTARRYLSSGITIFIFPEGTRSEDGELLCFKDGPFRLATETGTDVLPVVIEGTRDILPRGQWILNFDASIRVRVLEPIKVSEWNGDAAALCLETKKRIETELAKMRSC